MSGPVAFDVLGPLPRGRLSVEASAGTGKTYALSALAARYAIEDGVPIGEIVVATFTRAAAAELRERIWSRLADVAHALARLVAGEARVAPTDEVVAHLCAADHRARLERARVALAEFDAAQITTIHGFAQQVLATLGVAAPGDPDAALGDDGGELLRQVCTDVLAAESIRAEVPVQDLPSLDELWRASRDVAGNPGIRAVPGAEPEDSNPPAALRRCLVDAVAAEVRRRARATATYSFDDVLTRLRDGLAHPRAGAGVRAALRRRYRVALIDEFQDTDPVQWEILRLLFADATESAAPLALVLVGDPKQAIYGFRGANVHTYLDAVEQPGTRREVLGTNWRSDEPVLHALEALLLGATFGDDRIRFHRVEAPPAHHGRRLTADSAPLPGVRLRLALGTDLPRTKTHAREVLTDDAERAICADLAQSVRDLLEGATLPEGAGRPGAGPRPVRPNDVAVLVGSHGESPGVRDALRAFGIPAVIARGDSVFASPAATQWRRLLEALAQPADPQRARTACLGWFFGWPADRLVAAGAIDLADVQQRLHQWAATLVTRGVAEFLRVLWSDSGVAARVLGAPDGDRSMTDLDHIAELLAAAAPRRTGPAGLLATLDELTIDTTLPDVEVDVAARRVESDADAVQIMTVHAAKGLEFPVVCVPTLWRATYATERSVIYRDPEDGARTVDVAPRQEWPSKADAAARRALAADEAVGQNLRLLYVALTRARHQTLVWWTRAGRSNVTGLARVLFARDEHGLLDGACFAGEKVPLPSDDDAAELLRPVVACATGALTVDVIGAPNADRRPWAPGPRDVPHDLAVARLARVPDRTRHRWSFTAMTAHAPAGVVDPLDATVGDAGAGDEHPDGVPLDDEVVVPDPPESERTAAGAPRDPVPMGSLPAGAAFGTLVHDVLEHTDFTATDLDAALTAAVADAAGSHGLRLDEHLLVAGLRATITTPLGARFGGRSLRDLGPADRIDEMAFELPLGESGRGADDAAIGRLLLDHVEPGAPLRGWAERLASGCLETLLAGHLVGSVDLVARVPGAEAAPRFVVVDYKSNVLSERGAVPSCGDYHPDRLAVAMAAHDYPLQALLYSVALHRYLRWRVPGYDPATHLGGVAYLFVRGMVGPTTPAPGGRRHGVFSWDVPPALVEDLSDLLDGRESSARGAHAGAAVHAP
jgi:exodeoxyribonuclease V beta subunit